MEPAKGLETPGERRTIGPWGSFFTSQTAMGANLFVALGLVFLTARGATGVAFALSGLVFLFVGLSYVELASALPAAGGGQYFVMRGLGDFWGFVAGSALILDLTIGIALFGAVGASYVNTFAPAVLGVPASELAINLGILGRFGWFWFAESIAFAALLVIVNVRGMREPSGLGAGIGVAALAALTLLVVGGFLFAWRPETFREIRSGHPEAAEFAYGLSLSVISFVGLQTIALTASECRRPSNVVPRSSIAAILTVLLFALALSHLAMGVLSPEEFGHGEAPLSILALRVPPFGRILSGVVAALACVVLLVAANSFLASVSYVAYSMGRYDCLGSWSRVTHERLNTPVKALWFFGAVVIGELALAFVWQGERPLEVLANMYAFGALLCYTLVLIALVALRITDPALPRPYRVPMNLPVMLGSRRRQLPLSALLGAVGAIVLLVAVVATHEIGRVAGPGWIALSLLYYGAYRRKRGLPFLRSAPRDWSGEHARLLADAGERVLVEAYRESNASRRKARET